MTKISEKFSHKKERKKVDELMCFFFFPKLYTKKIEPNKEVRKSPWTNYYIHKAGTS